MGKLRALMIVLAVVHLLSAAFIALLAVAWGGGTAAVRGLLIIGHPVAAVLLMVVAVSTRPIGNWLRRVTLTLLPALLVGDVLAALLLAQGVLVGSWFFGLVFVAIPVLGAVYIIETT